METTDWHELEKHRFAKRVAAAEELMQAHRIKALVVVAPPRMLAELRHAFDPDVQRLIIAEIDKDLTKHSVSEIERHLVG